MRMSTYHEMWPLLPVHQSLNRGLSDQCPAFLTQYLSQYEKWNCWGGQGTAALMHTIQYKDIFISSTATLLFPQWMSNRENYLLPLISHHMDRFHKTGNNMKWCFQHQVVGILTSECIKDDESWGDILEERSDTGCETDSCNTDVSHWHGLLSILNGNTL